MKENIIQEPIELKFGNRAATIINGKKVFQIEEHVKINEKGDRALLSITVPAQLAKTKTFKLKITTDSAQILDKDLQKTAQSDTIKLVTSTIGTKTKETPNLYKIEWANSSHRGRIHVWAATPVEAFNLAGFNKHSDKAYQGIQQIQ